MFSLHIDDIVSATEPRPNFSVLWHSLLLDFSRIKLLPNDGVISHPRLHGLRSGRFAGNLRTAVLRRPVPLALDCPWCFSFALDRDWEFLAGSVFALDIGEEAKFWARERSAK